MFKRSIYSHLYIRGNIACIYNSIQVTMLFIKKDKVHIYYETGKYEELTGKDLEIANTLISMRNWVPENEEEISLSHKIFNHLDNGVEIKEMVLHLTDYCNLRCKYCFIEDGICENYTRRNMSWDVASHAIDKFFKLPSVLKNSNEEFTIVFYGGEPLLNWNVMKKCLTYISEKYGSFKVKTVVITNGTQITDEIAKTLKEYNTNVCVSIDGPKHVNDMYRVSADGKGSFDEVVNKIEILRKHGIEPGVSSVMTRSSIDNLSDVAQFLFGDLKIKGAGFNHVSIIPSSGEYSSFDEDYENKYGSSLLKMAEIINEKYPEVYEKRMDAKINDFLERVIRKSSCTGTGNQISVSTDGFIGICQGYMGSRKTFNNTVFDQNYYPENDSVFIEWSKRSPYIINECIFCPALSTCGGGCPRNAEMMTGSIWGLDSGFCMFSKKAQEWLIWKYYDENIIDFGSDDADYYISCN